LIASELDSSTIGKLENGANVLLLANGLGTEETSVLAHFYPLYWSLTFFPGQGKTCIGLLLNEKHPAFQKFPTSFHSNWQWESISDEAKGFILNDLPASFHPIAQPIDDFHRNNKVGSVFELKVGKGKLLVCGYNLNSELPVAKQLKFSLLHYMQSADFSPQQTVEKVWLQQLFQTIPKAKNIEVPEPFKNAIFMVEAAANVAEIEKSISWNSDLDKILILEKVNYKVKSDGVWKDNSGTAWHGKEMEITLDCPEGMLGSLWVLFHDWNNNNRAGLLNFEGRKMKLEKHSREGQWINFHVMREDSNDGKLMLKTNATSGPNLMITKIVLTQE
jgi:hypothetical protein